MVLDALLMQGSADESLLQLTALFGLLAVPRRRYLLYALLKQGGLATIDRLARQIAACECASTGETIDDDLEKRVEIALVHNHLPRLADVGLVEYDRRSGDVVLSEPPDAVERQLRQCHEDDGAPLDDVPPDDFPPSVE